MQPLPPITHPNPAFASLALRHAQRAFAPLLERDAGRTPFRFAQLLGAARRVLSGLSADDRVRLARWLALLCAVIGEDVRTVAARRIARVDRAFAANVDAARAVAGERLPARGAKDAVAA